MSIYYKDFPFVHAFVAGDATAASIPHGTFDIIAFFKVDGDEMIDAWSAAEEYFEELVKAQPELVCRVFSDPSRQDEVTVYMSKAQKWLFDLGYESSAEYPPQDNDDPEYEAQEKSHKQKYYIDDPRIDALIATVY